MARKRANKLVPSGDLALAMTRVRALEITERVPLCSILQPIYRANGWGPYWEAFFMRDGIPCRVYVGNNAKRHELAQAHAFVRAELEAAASKLPPETRELISLERRLLGDPPLLPPRARMKKTDPERAASASGSLLGSSHPSRREASR